MSNFFDELKNRNVYKAATAYVVTGWLVMQVVDTMSNNLEWPPAIASWITKILIVGFPIALVLTWLYEFTPQGLKRTGAVQEDTSDNRRAGRRLNHTIISVLALAICFMLVERVFFAGDTSINPRQQASIAVLPFENISTLEDSENFAKGLSEQILNDLALLSGLKVIAPNSSFFFEDKSVDDKEIGEQLKVNYLLKGSLQYDQRSNRVKIFTRLVNANNGHYLWSDTYEGDFVEIFGIQEDVGRKVASQLQVTLLPREDKALGATITKNSEAYKLYLQSKNFSKKRTDHDLEKAIELLNEAIELDPNFAEAHAELVYIIGNRFFYGNMRKEDRDELMEYHMNKALEIAPDKAEVLWAKARYFVGSPKDSSQVIADLRRAIELKPNYSDAYFSLARALHGARMFDLVLDPFEKAVALDPKNTFLISQLASFYYMYGHVEKGIETLDELIARDSVGMLAKALMISREPRGEMIEAFKLIYQTSKRDHKKNNYGLMSFGYPIAFSLDLDLWPVSEKYASLMQMRYPENHNTFNQIWGLYSFTGKFTLLEEVLDLWASEKGLDPQEAALVKTDIRIHENKYQEALRIYENAYPTLSMTKFHVDSLDYGSNYNDLWNYTEILRLNNENTLADSLATKICEFYTIQSTTNRFLPAYVKNKYQMDCYYLTNDTTRFVKALEDRFFVKKDRLGVFTDLKSGLYKRFHENLGFQKLYSHITEETHRMRAEVIAYLKEEGDWDPAWDAELGLD